MVLRRVLSESTRRHAAVYTVTLIHPPSTLITKKKKKLKEPLTGKLLNCNGKQCNELESLWIKRIN